MKSTTYRQCALRHPDGRTLVSWIPAKFAVTNEVLKLKRPDGTWDNGWIVTSVGAERTSEDVSSFYNLPKRHRHHADRPRGTFRNKGEDNAKTK